MKDKTVLIVDDSHTLRRILKFNLKSIQGFKEQLEAENGKDALVVLTKNKVDLILLDINMPIMNGFEFIERVKNDFDLRKIPIIVLTTEGDDENRKKALNMGADAYLTKPFQSPELKKVIKDLFG